MDQWNPAKLSLKDFLEAYRNGDVFAITTDQLTQAYVIWLDGEETGDDKFYTHPACDEAPITEYIEFMIELRHLRFSRYRGYRTASAEG